MFSGENQRTSTSLPAAIPEIDQLKFSLPTVNQAAFQANPVQSYIATQPYSNPFTGKGMKVLSSQRSSSASVPSLTSRQLNAFHRYPLFPGVQSSARKTGNRLHLTAKNQVQDPQSRQLGTQKIIPVSASGIIPLSIIKNIPILKSYNGSKLVISRSNSFLMNKLFPFAKTDSPGPKTELQSRLGSPATFRYPNVAFYFKPPMESKVLTKSIPPFFPKEYYLNRDFFHTYETDATKDKLKTSRETNPLARVGGSYGDQNIIASFFANGYLNVPRNSVKQSYGHTEPGQALSNPYSYFKPRETSVSANSFQLTRGSHFTPAIAARKLANDIGFQSPLNKGFYFRSLPRGKGHKTGSTADRVVTEGELRDKGLLSDILSRNHINHITRGKIWRKRHMINKAS